MVNQTIASGGTMEQDKFYYSEYFKKISNGQKMLLDQCLAEYGITYAQSLVILYLFEAQDMHKVSQKDIEKYLSLKGSTVTHILNRMEENEFVYRQKSKEDNRVNHLFLTQKGITYYPLFFKALDAMEKRMTQGLSAGEKEQLKRLLLKVLENLEEN